MRSVSSNGDWLRSRRLRRALAEELMDVLPSAKRSADDQDAEADPGQEERDADDDAEERHVLGQVARVERGRECGLGDPDVSNGIVDRLAVAPLQRLGRVVRALAVS